MADHQARRLADQLVVHASALPAELAFLLFLLEIHRLGRERRRRLGHGFRAPELHHARGLVFGNVCAVNAVGLGLAGGREQHVAVAQQVLGAVQGFLDKA